LKVIIHDLYLQKLGAFNILFTSDVCRAGHANVPPLQAKRRDLNGLRQCGKVNRDQ
jgi:hypothetical protein